MFAVVMISMLMIFGSGIYLIYHFIRKIKNRDRLLPKKKFYSILIGSVIAFIVSASFLDTDDISAYNEIKKLNSELTENNLVLSAQVDDANKNNDELKEEIKQLKESHTTEIEEIQNEHKEEIASLTEKHKTDIKKLEDENEKLVTEKESLETQKTDLESKKASLEGKVKELEGNLAQAQAKKETTSKPDDSGSATKSSGTTNNNNSTSTASASANESCDIKGSKTGIYHTPGSTYYNKTTNVVQWFCSTTEAEAAGYRAPKR